MKSVVGSLIFLLTAGPSVSFFRYDRQIHAGSSGGQAYIIVDHTMWKHARSDLADVRLYGSDGEVPYALKVEQGGSQTDRKELRVVQPGVTRGKTQFLLDMSGVEEYDRVDL